jgi:nucleoside-diphosphate-sugar epimerase
MTEHDKDILYISENVRLMDNVFTTLAQQPIPFLFASSQMSNMFNTNYGFLKNLGERYTATLPAGWMCRFWNVYGYEDPTDLKSHVITDFIHMAKTCGAIKMRTDGSETRQFLFVDDCSKALLHWCENYHLYSKTEFIDITSFEWSSILDIAHIVQKHTGCSIEVGTKKDTLQAGVVNQPSKHVLKFWKPEVTLEEGIKKLL